MSSQPNYSYSSQQFPPLGEDPNIYSSSGIYQCDPHRSSMPPPSSARKETIESHGVVKELTAKGGMILYGKGSMLSFQTEHFCDKTVEDFLKVLRVGMVLGFKAVKNDNNQFIITEVFPLPGVPAQFQFEQMKEIDSTLGNFCGKEEYDLVLERKAYDTLLAVFRNERTEKIMLKCLKGTFNVDESLYNYIGTSGERCRQFVERRTHIFRLKNDVVFLQLPSVNLAVNMLNSFLLRRGGVVSIDILYGYYVSPLYPRLVRNHVGFTRKSLMNLLKNHPFIFSVFPNNRFVSSRRNLPLFDYPTFIDANFPDLEPVVSETVLIYSPSECNNAPTVPSVDSGSDQHPTFDNEGPYAYLVAHIFGPKVSQSMEISSGSSESSTPGEHLQYYLPKKCKYNLFGPNNLLRDCLETLCHRKVHF